MENKQSNKKIPTVWTWITFGFFLVMLFVFFNTIASEIKQDSSVKQIRKEENKQTLALVNFTGSKFVITNKNDFDWDRVEIIVNEKFRYEIGGMKTGSTYEVGAGQFTDSKNNRFNPFDVKPAEIRIYVKEPTSDDWYGELR